MCDITVEREKGKITVLNFGAEPMVLKKNKGGDVFLVPDGFKLRVKSNRIVWIGETRIIKVPDGQEVIDVIGTLLNSQCVRNGYDVEYRFTPFQEPLRPSETGWRSNPTAAFKDAYRGYHQADMDEDVLKKNLKGCNGKLIMGVAYRNVQRVILRRFRVNLESNPVFNDFLQEFNERDKCSMNESPNRRKNQKQVKRVNSSKILEATDNKPTVVAENPQLPSKEEVPPMFCEERSQNNKPHVHPDTVISPSFPALLPTLLPPMPAMPQTLDALETIPNRSFENDPQITSAIVDMFCGEDAKSLKIEAPEKTVGQLQAPKPATKMIARTSSWGPLDDGDMNRFDMISSPNFKSLLTSLDSKPSSCSTAARERRCLSRTTSAGVPDDEKSVSSLNFDILNTLLSEIGPENVKREDISLTSPAVSVAGSVTAPASNVDGKCRGEGIKRPLSRNCETSTAESHFVVPEKLNSEVLAMRKRVLPRQSSLSPIESVKLRRFNSENSVDSTQLGYVEDSKQAVVPRKTRLVARNSATVEEDSKARKARLVACNSSTMTNDEEMKNLNDFYGLPSRAFIQCMMEEDFQVL